MKLSRRIYGLLALLIVGSASLQAQDDPFPDNSVPSHKYQGNMTITSQVVQNGVEVTDAVVAVYCGDDFRGKGAVGNDPDHPGLVYLSAYGNYTGADQYLYFKVYTNGTVFTCNPAPAITYTYNGSLGTTSNPYNITLPLSLANNADNTEILTTWNTKSSDVILTDRTFYKDGAWNTLCLPFSLSETALAVSPLAGATLMELDLNGTYDEGKKTGYDASTGTLYLYFKSSTSITVGTPYIIKWGEPEGQAGYIGTTIDSPIFTGITISNATNDVDFNGGSFKGTYLYMPYAAENKNILLLGESNTLYWPLAGATIGAFRSYFQLADNVQASKFVLDFYNETNGTVGIKSEEGGTRQSSTWFSLEGNKLAGKPTKKGLYIHNGLKVVIK